MHNVINKMRFNPLLVIFPYQELTIESFDQAGIAYEVVDSHEVEGSPEVAKSRPKVMKEYFKKFYLNVY